MRYFSFGKCYAAMLSCILVLLFYNTNAQTNVALGKTVTGSSLFSAARPHANLVDGDYNTFAITSNTLVTPHAEWFQIDLGGVYTIDSIVLSTSNDRSSFNRHRRFMIVTSVGTPGGYDRPDIYLTSSSIRNRLIYTKAADVTSAQPFGCPNASAPEAAGIRLGPAFPADNKLKLFIGVHRARYVKILSLQDDYLEFNEVEVYKTEKQPIRILTNGSFEQNLNFAITSYQQIKESQTPEWNTTEAVAMINTTGVEGGSFIEVWGKSFMAGVPAYDGNYLIELNAYTEGMVVTDPVCVLPGETFAWSFAHRGRSGIDTMAVVINDKDMVQVRDNNATAGAHNIIAGTVDVSITAVKGATNASGWTIYRGTWVNPSATASTEVQFGFRAIGSAGGSIAVGNLLDSVSIKTQSILASFDVPTASGPEDIPTNNLPKLFLRGSSATAGSIKINITGGSATRGKDYTTSPATGLITIPVPAGDYDGKSAASYISLAPYIQIANDGIRDDGETIDMTIQDPTGKVIVASDVCVTTTNAHTYTIQDLSTLPIVLVSFKASQQKDCSIVLNWASGAEDELEGYEVQHSIDGKTYEHVTLVVSKGANSKYSYVYKNPPNGNNYFRLKFATTDNSVQKYSAAVRVNNAGCTQRVIKVYPTKVTPKRIVTVTGLLANEQVQVFDMQGKLVRRKTATGTKVQLNLLSLAAGEYVVLVRSKGQTIKTTKVMLY